VHTRIRISIVGFLFFLAGFLVPTAFANEYRLQNQFNAGETLYISLKTKITGFTKIEQQATPSEVEMNSVIRFETKSVEGNLASVHSVVDSIQVIDPSRLSTEDLYRSLEGEDKTFTIDTLGRIKNYEKSGASTATDNILSNSRKSITERRPWVTCPENAISIGDKWVEQQVVPLSATSEPILSTIEYTLAGVQVRKGETIATISYTNTIIAKNVTYDPAKPGEKVHLRISVLFHEYTLNGTGTVEFNMDKGLIETFVSRSDLTIDMENKNTLDSVEMPSKAVLTLQMNSIGRVSGTKPENTESELDSQ